MALTNPNQTDEEDRIVQAREEHLERVGLAGKVGVVRGTKHRLGVGTSRDVVERMERNLQQVPGYEVKMVKNEHDQDSSHLWQNTLHTAEQGKGPTFEDVKDEQGNVIGQRMVDPGTVIVHDPMTAEQRRYAEEHSGEIIESGRRAPGVTPALMYDDMHTTAEASRVGAEGAEGKGARAKAAKAKDVEGPRLEVSGTGEGEPE